MPNARRGEVWLVDLGLAAKTRPALILNIPFLDNERALFLIMPHTTATRGTRFEAVVDVRWLEKGAFDAQGIRNVPGSVLLRRLGVLSDEQMKLVEAAVRRIFGLE
ncbi:MAG: type II toxin-antitoxin system PemK/MazF family toxin [Verrucomicrobia bacterium]|nr:type II toxin-antitoxin system PemK/MazF family toxin [Verrucomicrobiota bacterium]